MRFRLAQVVVFAIAYLLAGNMRVQAQATAPDVEAEKSCPPSSASHGKQPSDPEISVAGVTFSGFLEMPVAEQNEVAASIKGRTYRGSIDQATDEALEIARRGWQNRGYFKVRDNANATTLTSTSAGGRILLNVYVAEGQQYSLGGITFRHNRAIGNLDVLRAVFQIEDGDTFSREKIMTGLENLRKVYGELGYINFVSIPNATFNDEKRLIYLDIDIDEGKQFSVGDIKILGLDETARTQMLRDFLLQPGQIYNQRLVELSMLEHGPMLPNCECGDRPALWLDEKTRVVTLTFDFRSCLGGR